MQDIPDRLARCEKLLRDACARVEPDFLKLGDDLQRIYAEASDLTRQTADAVRISGGDKDGDVFNRVVAAAKDALKTLKADRRRTSDGLNMLGDILGALHRLDTIGGKLNTIAKTLKMIGFNIGVESVRSEGAQDLFAALAREIKDLGDTVRELFHSIRADVHGIQSHLAGFHQEVCSDLDCLKTLFEDSENAFRDAVPSVERVLSAFDRIFQETGQISKEISDHVGGIVVGIQVHDSTRQRIEHIAAAMDEAKDLCGQAAGRDKAEGSEQLGAAYSILSLQRTQLLQVVEEIETVHQTGARAFVELQQVVDRISQTLSALSVGDVRGDTPVLNKKNAVEELRSILENIHSLLTQGATRMAYLSATVDKTSASIAKLTSHMDRIREINLNIHLKAINAIANSLRLGTTGAAIRVLVHEMKDLAEQSNTLVADIEQVIRSVGSDTETITGLMGSTSGGGAEADRSGHLDVALSDFNQGCADYRENAHAIARKGMALIDKISHACRQLTFLSEFSGELAHHAKRMEEIGAGLKPWVKESDAEFLQRAGKLSERYTMQTERGVHAAFVKGGNGGGGSPADEAGKTVAMEKAEDALGDNVELF